MFELLLMLVGVALCIVGLLWYGTKRLPWVVMLSVTVSSLGIYGWVGGWPQLKAQSAYQTMVRQLNELYDEPNLTREKVEDSLVELSSRLPEHPFLWFRLGEIYEKLRWFDQAEVAYEHALGLDSQNEEIQLQFAYASAFASGGFLNDKSRAVIHQILSKTPHHRAAKNLIAMDFFKQANYLDASMIWQELLFQAGPDSERLSLLKAHQQSILAIEPSHLESNRFPIVRANLDLSQSIADVCDDDWPIFIVAKHTDHAGPPLAVAQLKVSDLPASVVLTKRQAMAKDVTLELGQDIIVTARVSKSSKPIAQSGDMEGYTDSVKLSGYHNFDILLEHIIE